MSTPGGDPTVLRPDRADLERTRTSFLRIYQAVAAAGLVFAVAVDRRWLPAAAAFVGMLVWWWRRVRGPLGELPSLIVSDGELRSTSNGVVSAVERSHVGDLRIRRRNVGRAGVVDELVARDGSGRVVVRIGVWDVDATIAALHRHGWPVARRR